jgi:hypothetical protein
MSRKYETTEAPAGEMTADERRRRNHPVLDVERTVERTYRDLLVFGDCGATISELHAEGFCRFTSAARRAALKALISSGHAEPAEVVRTFAATPTLRSLTRHVTIYRLTAAGIKRAESGLTDNDRERVAARRRHHANHTTPKGA